MLKEYYYDDLFRWLKGERVAVLLTFAQWDGDQAALSWNVSHAWGSGRGVLLRGAVARCALPNGGLEDKAARRDDGR